MRMLGEDSWEDLLLRGAAACLLWALTALWLAVPVGVLGGRGAAYQVFAALMNPPMVLLARLYRAFMGRPRRGADEEQPNLRLPAHPNPFLGVGPPPGFGVNPFVGIYRPQP